jgi:hypothetical protein
MKFAVSKGETSVADLTTRIFEIKGQGAAETTKRATAALLEANPHIKDLTKVPPGTIIVIPDLPDNPNVRAPQTAGVGDKLDDHLKIAVKQSAEVIGKSVDAREAAANATIEALKNRELRDFAAQTPELKEQLDKLGEAAKASVKDAKAASALEKEALAQLEEALKKLSL